MSSGGLPGALPNIGPKRDQWVLAQRGKKIPVDSTRPYHFLAEAEHGPHGRVIHSATIFLTNRECPFKCVMCDLWQHTLDHSVPPGAIPEQIRYALDRLPECEQVKLYNSGSFFDSRAIPPADYGEISELVSRFQRVVLECHPAFIGERVLQFQKLFSSDLEIAIGLETAHPGALEQLNKRMTLPQFSAAAHFLRSHGIALRVFLLVYPPFVPAEEQPDWLRRSIEFALGAGAEVISLIPTRAGNGALEALDGFVQPELTNLVEAHRSGLLLARGKARVFSDLWDLERFSQDRAVVHRVREQLSRMNLLQRGDVGQ